MIFNVNFYVERFKYNELQRGRLRQYQNNSIFGNKYSFYIINKIKSGKDYIFNVRAFDATLIYILLYGCTTWTLTKRLEKKLDDNYTRILRAILNKSWRQHPTRDQLYGHLPPITKTIQVRRTRHAGHNWRSKDEFISDVLLWTPTYGQAKAGRPSRTYIQQLCEDTETLKTRQRR